MKKYFPIIIVTFLLAHQVVAQFPGNALSFDGVNDYIELGTSGGLYNQQIKIQTVEVWIQANTTIGKQTIFELRCMYIHTTMFLYTYIYNDTYCIQLLVLIDVFTSPHCYNPNLTISHV